MNAPLTPNSVKKRHLVTFEEVMSLQEHGFFRDPKRVVLLDGEIYEMPSEGYRHIHWANVIGQTLGALLQPRGQFVAIQSTLRLTTHNAPSPDIYVLTGSLPEGNVAGRDILLVIEVADTSLAEDLKSSAARYARHGVREFWVVDLINEKTHVFRSPADGAYPPPAEIPFTDELDVPGAEGAKLRLADLAPR
jgi:Uma2 family endonuclease